MVDVDRSIQVKQSQAKPSKTKQNKTSVKSLKIARTQYTQRTESSKEIWNHAG